MDGGHPSSSVAIGGDVSGQVAVGRYVVQLQADRGAIVNLASAHQPVAPQPRARPVRLLPRDCPGLIGREQEAAQAMDALRRRTSVAVAGRLGTGKTALLRHLAHRAIAERDDIVHLARAGRPVDDLLQDLFRAFYEADIAFKPTQTELRRFLAPVEALVVLDDAVLSTGDVAALRDLAPGCAFLAALAKPTIPAHLELIDLRGLPEEAALELFRREYTGSHTRRAERELAPPGGGAGGRIGGKEVALARELCRMVDGHPGAIVQFASAARIDGIGVGTLVDLARRLSPRGALVSLTSDAVRMAERSVLETLHALAAPLPLAHLGPIARVDDVSAVVGSLEDRGLVGVEDGVVTIADPLLVEAPLEGPDATRARSLDHLSRWARTGRRPQREIAEAREAILAVQGWAADRGRWEDVLTIGEAVGSAFGESLWWGTWKEVLRRNLRAAEALGHEDARALALHELGTRALALDDEATGRRDLHDALRIREARRDRPGAQVTRHNLGLIGVVPPEPSEVEQPTLSQEGAPARIADRLLRTGRPWWAWLVLALLFLGLPSGTLVAWLLLWPRLAGPPLAAAPQTVWFGEQRLRTSSPPARVAVLNAGSGRLEGLATRVVGVTDFAKVEDECGRSLGAGDRCDVSLTFTPSRPGTRSGALLVTHDELERPVAVSLLGTGVVRRHSPPTTIEVVVNPTTRVGGDDISASVTIIFEPPPPPPGAFTCRAAVVRHPNSRTVEANRERLPCRRQVRRGLPRVGLAPLGTAADGVHAETRPRTSRGAVARAAVARFVMRAPTRTGSVLIAAQGVRASASARCAGGAPAFASRSSIGRLVVAGQPVDDDGPVIVHDGVRIELHREVHRNGEIVRQAIRIDAPGAGRTVVAEASVGTSGNPCDPRPTP